MTAQRIRVENFGGEIPRRSRRLLPPTHGQTVKNAKLYSGELRGLRALEIERRPPDGTKKTYRLPDNQGVGGFTWVDLNSLDHYIYRGPLLNDQFDRYYRFGDGVPRYNTLERIRNDDPWWILGVTQPVASLLVTPTGGSGDTESRFYTYTFVSAYGEEGPPADPGNSATGFINATWELSGFDTTVPDASERNITHKNIYRTVSGFAETQFFFVAQIPLAQATYSDTASSEIVSRNNLLESEQWLPPATEFENALVMPNGFFVAWKGRDVYMSETYRPHAWPPAYDLSTEYDIIGGGIFGQSIAMVTDGNPYVGTGVTPESTTLVKTNTVEPGLSKYGIVSLENGVLYPSQNGLMLVNESGVSLVTRPLLTKEEWLSRFSPQNIIAAQYQASYIAFYTPDDGFIMDPQEPQATFVELDQFNTVQSVQTDVFTGDVFITTAEPLVYNWDVVTQPRVAYTWRSKDFQLKKPVNFGALKINAETDDEILEEEAEAIALAQRFNQARIVTPLDTIGEYVIGGSTTRTIPPPDDEVPQNRQALGGSPLIDVSGQNNSQLGLLRINVYSYRKLVYTNLWQDRVFKLPSGFKSAVWSFELTGTRHVYSFEVAETEKGLEDA